MAPFVRLPDKYNPELWNFNSFGGFYVNLRGGRTSQAFLDGKEQANGLNRGEHGWKSNSKERKSLDEANLMFKMKKKMGMKFKLDEKLLKLMKNGKFAIKILNFPI